MNDPFYDFTYNFIQYYLPTLIGGTIGILIRRLNPIMDFNEQYHRMIEIFQKYRIGVFIVFPLIFFSANIGHLGIPSAMGGACGIYLGLETTYQTSKRLF